MKVHRRRRNVPPSTRGRDLTLERLNRYLNLVDSGTPLRFVECALGPAYRTVTIGTSFAVVRVVDGAVFLRQGEQWEMFAFPKRTKGRQAAKVLFHEIVDAKVLAARRAEEARLAVVREAQRVADWNAKKAEEIARVLASLERQKATQAQVDALKTARQIYHNDVHFYANDSGGVRVTIANVDADVTAKLLDMMLEHGLIRALKRSR